jgi:AraC-like DNA-binding protein/mannose-6-phosphate isomerase-like protein (cupin superfamily)
MGRKRYLRVTFDTETDKKLFQETGKLEAIPQDVFSYLKILSYLMPDIVGINRWKSQEIGPKKPCYHGNLHEIVFVFNGKGTYIINDKEYPVNKRDVVLIKPNEVHKYSDSSDIECISLHFSFSHLDLVKNSIEKTVYNNCEDEFLEFLTDHYPEIHKITATEGSQILNRAHHLFLEFQSPSPGSKLMISLYFIEILVLLARNYLYGKKGDNLIPEHIKTRNDIMVKQILQYLDTNYAKRINPTDLFKNYYMHPNYCRYIFKKAIGSSLSHCILKKRMTEAKRLLIETNLPIKEIAEKVGVNDYFYFLRAFKEVHGITPNSLRKAPSY